MDVRWIRNDGAVSLVPLAQITDLIARDDGIVWAHLNHDDEVGMSILIMTVAPRPDDLREVSSRTRVPRLHMYSDHLFSAINGIARGSDGLLHMQPLKVFLTPRVLWTVLGPATTALPSAAVTRDLDIVRGQLDDEEIRPQSALELIAAIRAVMIRGQEDLIAAAATQVAELERRTRTGDPMSAESVLAGVS